MTTQNKKPSGNFIKHIACTSPSCTSSDGMAVYEQPDGSHDATCFVCGHYDPNPLRKEEETVLIDKEDEVSHKMTIEDIQKLPIQAISDRKISVKVAKKYGVRVSFDQVTGEVNAHYYPIYKKGKLTGYKKRALPKQFSSIGDVKGCELFGAQVAGANGKMLIITEGELDALAAAQLFYQKGKNYRVVSLPHGANVRSIKDNLEVIESYKTIVLCFDQDEAGQEAVEAAAELFTPGKVKIMRFSEKDPCDMLKADKGNEFYSSLVNAVDHKPDGIVSMADIREKARQPVQWGLAWPWESLTNKTYGRRRKELYGFGAGSGCVDADTEFLSPNGWVPISEYMGEMVAQYDLSTETVTFTKPIEYIKNKRDTLYSIKTKYGIDMCLSPDHRVLSITKDGSKNVRQFSEVIDIHDKNITGFREGIPTTFKYTGEGLRLSDMEIRLQVAANADGYWGKWNQCHVSLKKSRKKARLEWILEATGYKYNKYDRENGYTVYSFIPPMNKGYEREWYGCTQHQLSIISEEVLLWDGDQKSSFSTKIKSDADFIQFVWSACGFRSSIYKYDRGGGEYSVGRNKRVLPSFRKTARFKPEIVPHKTRDGYEYCFRVPTGFLVLRRNGNVFITGNCGKTEGFKEIIQHVIENDNLPVGVFFLEEPPETTAKVLAGKFFNKRFHVPDAEWTQDELDKGLDALDGKIYFYNHFGQKSYESLKAKIRYMVISLGVKDIFIDHLTALVTEELDVNAALGRIMADMASLTQELDFTLYFISHLSTPNGTPHEEGGRVTASQFRGSRTIMFWSHFLFGYERNQQAESEAERNTTTFRVLKDRYTGLSTGHVFKLFYDHNTGRMQELDYDELEFEG